MDLEYGERYEEFRRQVRTFLDEHKKQRPAGASSHTSQLHAHSRFEHVYQVSPSITAWPWRMPWNWRVTM